MSHQPSAIIATASYDCTIRFWEAETTHCYRAINCPALPERELYEDPDKPQHVNKLEISPDKRHLAAACNPYIRLFDINSHYAHVRTFVSHTSNVTAVGFHADSNSMYSGSEDGTVRIWDLRSPNQPEVYERNCQKAYHAHESVTPINTVVLHPNQTELISGDKDGIIRVWDTRMNACTIELVPEPDTAIRSLSFMRDGTMLVAANDGGTCYTWNILRGNQVITEFEPIRKLQAHNRQILKCVISPDNKYLVTASSDKTVKIWNIDNFTLVKVLTGHQRWVWDCAFSVDGKFLLTGTDLHLNTCARRKKSL
ncbi:Transducin/WD40 repeat-like superfamily protein [Raphanus sativus]|nr:Transducin/WD40 repeat-like superfamily protein [Raphanus sativus]